MLTRISAIVLVLLAPAGCSPLTVSFTLFADNGRLRETVVESDANAGEAKVVMIDIRGLIADREDSGLLSRGPNPVDDLVAKLRRAEQDRGVKGVILRINSPGGTVAASDMMYREVRAYAQRTGHPVVASLGEIAASGGYYLALSADRIVAEPASITGSIGVIIPTVNVSEGLARIGIRSRSVTSRPNKDLANPLEPMREEHYAVLQGLVDEFYDRFRSLAVERRGPSHAGSASADAAPVRLIDMAKVETLTDGRVMTGVKAEEAGLADQTGGIHEAFDVAKRLAGLHAARLVKYYREDSDRPRTAYASSAVPPEGQGSEINLLQLRLGGSALGWPTPGAYYLWLPPG